jgi:hypothetical protein
MQATDHPAQEWASFIGHPLRGHQQGLRLINGSSRHCITDRRLTDPKDLPSRTWQKLRIQAN